jgi:hypothetical protein
MAVQSLREPGGNGRGSGRGRPCARGEPLSEPAGGRATGDGRGARSDGPGEVGTRSPVTVGIAGTNLRRHGAAAFRLPAPVLRR